MWHADEWVNFCKYTIESLCLFHQAFGMELKEIADHESKTVLLFSMSCNGILQHAQCKYMMLKKKETTKSEI
jgi:hypothetical protein